MAFLGLIFDLIMTALLAATIFYAVRLSRDLETFRTTRTDLAQAMQEIAGHVTKAQQAVEELRAHAGQSSVHLQSLITSADQVSRELEMIIEAGNALAGRLEGVATQAAAARPQNTHRAAQSAAYTPPAPVPDRPYQARGDVVDGPAFAIRDREYDDGASDDTAASGWGDDADDDGFFSKAERDLAAVLNKRRQRRG